MNNLTYSYMHPNKYNSIIIPIFVLIQFCNIYFYIYKSSSIYFYICMNTFLSIFSKIIIDTSASSFHHNGAILR